MRRDWKTWFEGYATEWTRGEVETLAARYAPRFQTIKPGKSAVYDNDSGFRRWLDGVRQHHLDWGLQRVEIVTVREMALGAHHTLVSVLWAVQFEQRSTLRIQFEIAYVLAERGDDEPMILTIISHEDQRAAMRRYELLPA